MKTMSIELGRFNHSLAIVSSRTFSTYPSTMLGSGWPGCCCWAAIRTVDRAVVLWMLLIRSCIVVSFAWLLMLDSGSDRLLSIVRVPNAVPFDMWASFGDTDNFCVLRFFNLLLGIPVDFWRWLLALIPGGATYFCTFKTNALIISDCRWSQ